MNDTELQIGSIHRAQVQSLYMDELTRNHVKAGVLRLDKIHPVVSGNKWFKLKYHFREATQQQLRTVITFGGAWSNHIVATAFAAQQAGLSSIGLIRGEKPGNISGTLQAAAGYGMKFEFLSREAYKLGPHKETILKLQREHGPAYIIPEGGSGLPGIRGCKEILQIAPTSSYSHIACCIGTGTMFLGLTNESSLTQQIIGVPVLKGMHQLPGHLLAQLEDPAKAAHVFIAGDYHFGGYARKTPELIGFMNSFYLQTGICSDFVYTGKLFFAVADLVRKGFFLPGSNLLIIHSGGLQGNASLPPGTLNF